MAHITFDPPGHISFVVKGESGTDLNVAPRLKVARSAACDIVFLVFGLVEMADEALHVGYDHVGALNDLGVAGGAAKLLLSHHLFDMPEMAEGHVLEDDRILQV
jgi:hypothetical protein